MIELIPIFIPIYSHSKSNNNIHTRFISALCQRSQFSHKEINRDRQNVTFFFRKQYSRRNPDASGERSGLQMRSRSPSSLVCASSDSSLTGGDNDVQAGLDESVRNDSLPLNRIPYKNWMHFIEYRTLVEGVEFADSSVILTNCNRNK